MFSSGFNHTELKLTRAEKEVFAQLPLNDYELKDQQVILARELAQLYAEGSEDVARNDTKSEMWAVKAGDLKASTPDGHGIFLKIHAWYTHIRLALAGSNALARTSGAGFLPSWFSYFGLVYFIRLFVDIGMVLHATFRSDTTAFDHQYPLLIRTYTRFRNAMREPGRLSRMTNDTVWATAILTGIILSGPLAPIVVPAINVAATTFDLLHDTFFSYFDLRPYQSFEDKINHEIHIILRQEVLQLQKLTLSYQQITPNPMRNWIVKHLNNEIKSLCHYKVGYIHRLQKKLEKKLDREIQQNFKANHHTYPKNAESIRQLRHNYTAHVGSKIDFLRTKINALESIKPSKRLQQLTNIKINLAAQKQRVKLNLVRAITCGIVIIIGTALTLYPPTFLLGVATLCLGASCTAANLFARSVFNGFLPALAGLAVEVFTLLRSKLITDKSPIIPTSIISLKSAVNESTAIIMDKTYRSIPNVQNKIFRPVPVANNSTTLKDNTILHRVNFSAPIPAATPIKPLRIHSLPRKFPIPHSLYHSLRVESNLEQDLLDKIPSCTPLPLEVY